MLKRRIPVLGLLSVLVLAGCNAGDPTISRIPTNDPIGEALLPGDPAMRPAPPGPFVDGHPYTIMIKTGDLKDAGTDAHVYISLVGTKDDSEDILLDDPQRNDFERGHTDSFHFEYRDLGKIKAIWLRQDNTGFGPGWYVDWVKVRDDATGQTYVADLHRWIAADQGDRLTKVFRRVQPE